MTDLVKKQLVKPPQRPDEEAFKKAQEDINAKINGLRKKSDAVKERLNNAPGKGSGNDKREELRGRLNDLRRQQAEIKQSKQGVFDQLSALDASIKKKIVDVKAAKLPYKTTAEIDNRISELDQKVESGILKLVEEKRFVAEISSLKKARKAVEAQQVQQAAIDADKQTYDELKKTIDDSGARAISQEFDEVRAQLDALQKDYQSDREKRDELYNEQTALRQQLDEAYSDLRALRDEYKAKNDEYYAHQRQAQIQRREAARIKQQVIDEEKRQAAARNERELAEIPAFEEEIITCENLINFLKPSAAAAAAEAAATTAATTAANVRQVDSSNAPQGVALKKKADRDEDTYFVGGKYAKKSKGQPKQAASPGATSAITPSGAFKIPLNMMEAFFTVDVAVPTSAADVDRAVEALRARLAHYKAEQPKVTEEKKRKAEEKIATLLARQEEKRQSRQNGAPKPAEDAFIDPVEVESVTVSVAAVEITQE
ncbi:hypothetical protein BC936DRAFT_138166 [Jimgerdemannia flammicorona]|uniref:Uncharacterized protein n=2 Tax=Jimgerdemannia flammicorona TaxID=994334 RepID=A0A433QVU1_9FUNG|nr:hypothetical protein BC936DRAFT_138166 [Jimgerdemannia flammicorona]RUS33886.1 hypothetical protein BC938DRAFT_483374 [Jimgerdemannia flammicorona]